LDVEGFVIQGWASVDIAITEGTCAATIDCAGDSSRAAGSLEQSLVDTATPSPAPFSTIVPTVSVQEETGLGSVNPGSNDGSIVGGTAVNSPLTYPYFVHWPRIGCGAQLIHDDIVLCAAHCGSRDGVISETLYLLGTTRGTGMIRRAIFQASHPNYSSLTEANDYMVFKLDSSALVDSFGAATGAATVTLNTNSAIPVAGSSLRIMGYGTTSSGGFSSSTLLEATVQAVSDTACNAVGSYNGAIVENVMLCAGVMGGGIDTCQGKSFYSL